MFRLKESAGSASMAVTIKIKFSELRSEADAAVSFDGDYTRTDVRL